MEPFDEYVSLGFNCEVSFQTRRAGQEQVHFFDWNSTTPQQVCALIEIRFDGMLADRTPDEWGHMVESPYGFKYHGRDTLEADRRVYGRLAWRFLRGGPRRCYFLQPHSRVLPSRIATLAGLLSDIPGGFEMVVVRRPGEAGTLDGIEHVHEREVAFFAPLNATDAADEAGWDAIFAEFPLVDLVVEPASDAGAAAARVAPA